jgi:hypothetical protein
MMRWPHPVALELDITCLPREWSREQSFAMKLTTKKLSEGIGSHLKIQENSLTFVEEKGG